MKLVHLSIAILITRLRFKRPTFKLKAMVNLFQLKYKVRGEAMKNPGEGIVRIAEEEKAEMIIMGTRGLGKVR